MGAPEHQHVQPFRPTADAEMSIVFRRLEEQVSWNYTQIRNQNQELQSAGEQIRRLQHEMVQAHTVIEELRAGRNPPRTLDPSRYDPADVEVLANQIATVTNKVNEVDVCNMQIDLLKQRLKRFEDAAATPGPQPEGPARRADPHYEALRAQQMQQAPGHPQSAVRPGAALPSEHGRQPGHPSVPVLESQPTPGFYIAHERQPNAMDQAQQPTRPPGFRAADPLPPPSNLSGWRPSESFQSSGVPPPPPAHSHPLRSHPPEPEPQPSGWAAVNAAKRPLDEHHPQHESSQPGSPKRPKLAPLKPRSSFGDEHHQSPYAQPAHVEASIQARGRLPSGEVPLQPHPPTNPAQAPGQASYRFITTMGQSPEEHWRTNEIDPATGARFEHVAGSTGRGRGRGSRGGRRGGRGRGGRSSSGAADITPAPDAPPQEHAHIMQAPPDWREQQWAASQQAAAASNGHYPGQHAYSPIEAARQFPPELGVHTGAPQHGLPFAPGHEHDFPATPIASNVDPYSMANDLDSANRKTRTKPIRNSDGVLIRKDGRPDMRSVSSANNLRKVHAKKEAEKAEMEGRTPTSGRSLAPANSSSLSDDEGMDEGDYMDEMDRERSEGRNGSTPGMHQRDGELPETLQRHRQLMNRIFEDDSARAKGTAEAYFPRVEGPPLDVKREDQENREREARWRGMEDTTMRDTEPGVERERSEHERREQEVPSQRPSAEQVSREQTVQTSTHSTPMSDPPASEPAPYDDSQEERDVNAAASFTYKGPYPADSSTTSAEKEPGMKGSTQHGSSASVSAERDGAAGEPVVEAAVPPASVQSG
jgi:hypothetical protein